MRRFTTLLACVSTVALLAACDPHYDNGYYDANGNYVSSENGANVTQKNHNNDVWPGKPIGYYNDSNNYNNDPSYVPPAHHVVRTTTVTTDDGAYLYERAGVYNLQGDYLGSASSNGIPSRITPSRGMCMVYFPDRMNNDQPQPQSCNGLMEHAPAGSLIVFGG